MIPRYLHPLKAQPKFRSKDFSVVQSYTTPGGVRWQHFQAKNPSVAFAYRHGLMVEYPNLKPVMVYGDYEQVQEITAELKVNPDRVEKSIRPLGAPGPQHYYLNRPENSPTHIQPTAEELEKYQVATAMYPDHDSQFSLRDRAQEEKRALDAHLKKVTPVQSEAAKQTPSQAPLVNPDSTDPTAPALGGKGQALGTSTMQLS
jgi:hypothetical protein